MNANDAYSDILLIYQNLLLGMGVVPSVLDDEDADVVLEVLGARKDEKLCYIDEV